MPDPGPAVCEPDLSAEDGTIAGIGGPHDFPLPSGIPVYDLQGKILAPGFIDLLVHGGG